MKATNKFIEDFKRKRKESGLSQGDLHKITGISKTTISSFENGKNNGIQLDKLQLLINAMDDEIDRKS